ncbi:hypothetical protein [Streptomyces sp. MST-110588]|uniref:hypothetical protein n=1 Tax=Streptomyces sp. MST-110588 TaxID=2833628 RepID=UPI001F5D750F|nr:hypothetical protein [Streptomyces sp. MST-110588]UNO42775.1 hypothetical protein KGS77_28640 [Streptomyces sp. MST-110588]
MSIDWAALGQVFGVTLVVTVGIVGLFTVGIVGTSRKRRPAGGAAPTGGPATTAPSAAARTGAYAAFALCAAAVAYGIYLIVAR